MALPIPRRELAAALGGAALTAALAQAAIAWAGRFALALVAGWLALVVLLAASLVYRKLKERIEDARSLSEASFALYQALRPTAPLPILRDFAIAPDSALLLHSLVRQQQPRLVVETGCGASTLVIAYTLKALGGSGRLISLELNESYARRTREQLAVHGLSELATVVHAPLTDVTVDGAAYRWHDASALAGAGAIDLVFDDGPPLYVGRDLRYAALPLLQPKLAPDAVYCLNFVGAEERRNVARWLARDGAWRAEFRPTRKGNVILRR